MAMSKDKQTLFVIGTDPAESEDTLHVIDIPSRQATRIKLPNSTTSDVRSLCVGPSSVAIPSPGGVILVLDPDTLQIRSVTTGNILFPHSCTFGPDGSLYVGADSNGGGLTPEVEVFSPQLNLMAEFELGTGSVSAMAAADNGKVLFVFGASVQRPLAVIENMGVRWLQGDRVDKPNSMRSPNGKDIYMSSWWGPGIDRWDSITEKLTSWPNLPALGYLGFPSEDVSLAYGVDSCEGIFVLDLTVPNATFLTRTAVKGCGKIHQLIRGSVVSTSSRYTLWVVASRLRNRNVRLRASCEWPPSRPTREFIAVAAFGRQLRESDALRSPTPRQSSNLGIRFLVDAFARPQHLVAT